MSHIETWKTKVRAVRANKPAAKEESPSDRWGDKRAAWFNRFAGKSDRSHTYRFIEPYVKGKVIEVGPGPGAYTRLLVEQAERVVAVESSPAMAARLRENLPDCDRLEIVTCAIEDYVDRLERYDLALAANVLSGIEPIDQVLWALARHATVLSIVMWSNAVRPAWSQAVQRELLGRSEPDPDHPSTDDLLGVLGELGLPYEAHDANVPVHTFARREDVVEWVEGFHGLPEERREELRRILTPFVEEQGGKYGLASGRATMVVNVFGATP